MTEAPEPKDKLDATTNRRGERTRGRALGLAPDRLAPGRGRGTAVAAADLHGVEGGGPARVRQLQKLMLRSRSNTLVSVRRVTERNAGRLTAGVDGEVVLTPEAKAELADRIQHRAEPFKAMPVRRVYIPKPGSARKRRPLGIPVIVDRVPSGTSRRTRWSPSGRRGSSRGPTGSGPAAAAMTRSRRSIRSSRARARNGSGCWTQIWPGRLTASPTTTFWPCSAAFPARGMIGQWLKAGVVEQGRLHRTEEGTPQGGVVSPVLLNVALHGMETGRRSPLLPDRHSAGSVAGSPAVIRYADDLVALCHTRQQAIEVKARLAAWLAPRGLAFNEDKTRVVTLDEGFDFLGFNVRRYRQQAADQAEQGGRQTDPGTAPHRAAVPARDQRSGGDQTAQPDHSGLGRLLPDTGIRPRSSASWTTTCGGSPTSGPSSATRTSRHPGSFPGTSASSTRPGRTDGCSATAHSGAFMHKFAWTNIVRHQIVRQGASPDDPALSNTGPGDDAKRPCRSTTPPSGSTESRTVAARSARATLLAVEDQPQTPREWEHWLATTRKTIDVTSGPRHAGQG